MKRIALVLFAAMAGCHPWYRVEEVEGRANEGARREQLMQRAQDAHDADRAADAAELALEAIRADPAAPIADYERAVLYLDEAGRTAEARALARWRLARGDAGDAAGAQLRRAVGASYLREGLVASALDEAVRELGPELASVIGELALASNDASSPEATAHLDAWLAEYGIPDHALLRAAADRIRAAAWERRSDARFAALATSADRADEELAAGNVDVALELYGDAYRLLPLDVLTAHWSGFVRAASQAGEPSERDPIAYELAQRGDEELARGALGPALHAYRRAVAHAPWWASAHRNLAAILSAAGRAEEASSEFEWAQSIEARGAPPAPLLDEASEAIAIAAPASAPPSASTDVDGDGIADSDDSCPDVREDRDGFNDEDGCPELDNDSDGHPDASDACPNEPEDQDGVHDEDGCPDADEGGGG